MISVQLFIPCFVDQFYPQTGLNMVKVLEHFGCEVSYNPNQTCCGQPAYNAGYIHEAKKVATKFINDYNNKNYIVTPSGSCTGYVRHGFDKMFDPKNDIWVTQNEIKSNLFEFTEFLNNILKIDKFKAQLNAKVTYHDACGALRECGIKEGPRKILSQIKGLELIEMGEAETCCGFGGTFAVKYEPISIGMADTKVSSALQTSAQYIVTTDVSCMMHIQGYIDKNNLPIQTIHIADLLAKALF